MILDDLAHNITMTIFKIFFKNSAKCFASFCPNFALIFLHSNFQDLQYVSLHLKTLDVLKKKQIKIVAF